MWNHFKEIRQRSVYLSLSFLLTFLTTYWYSFELIFLVVKPFLFYGKDFVFLDLHEAFYTTVYVCTLVSLLSILPLLLYQIWSFAIPSCYQKERGKIHLLLLFSFLTSLTLLSISYSSLLPFLSSFLLGFQVETEFVTLHLQTRISSYVGWSTRLLGGIFCLSQLPTLLLLLFYWKASSGHALSRFRRHFLVASLLIAAILSPPEMIAQSLLAFSLLFFYELSIWTGFVYYSLSIQQFTPPLALRARNSR
jgi:sec-independent protein translocase protein TatC